MKVTELLNQKTIDWNINRDIYPWREMKRKIRNTDASSGVPEFSKILKDAYKEVTDRSPEHK